MPKDGLDPEAVAAMEAAAEKPKEATASDLKRVQEMAVQVVQKTDEIAIAEAALKTLQEDLRKLKDTKLPELMQDELGLTSVELDDGNIIRITSGIKVSIAEANRPKAFNWLEKNGHGSLIKHNLSADLPREMSVVADSAIRLLELVFNISAKQKEAVNWQTLQAFGREQLEKGTALPDSITVFEYTTAELIKPKSK